MYTFVDSVTIDGIQFAWFTASGRSVWDIAWLYQNGYIKDEFIYARGKDLDIYTVNTDEYQFTPNTKYHLVFGKSETNNGESPDDKPDDYLRLKLYFEAGDYVASWYRLEIESDSILPETWGVLFGSNEPPVAISELETEYADFVEEIFVDADDPDDNLDESDTDSDMDNTSMWHHETGTHMQPELTDHPDVTCKKHVDAEF